MAQNSDVINWEEAMQQCGDDEEFLRELLADLRQEVETQVIKIAVTIQVRNNEYIQRTLLVGEERNEAIMTIKAGWG